MNIKSFVASLLTAAVALVGFGKTGPEIQYLDTYDQLTKVIGQEGHWFVRDASNTRTGQHGDPTVNKGWAIYTWDVKINGWRKICEEESLDNSVSEALLRQYVKVATFNEAMQTIANTYTSLKTHNDDKRLLEVAIGDNRINISRLDGRINEVATAAEGATTTANYAKEQVLIVKAMVEALDIDTVKVLLSQTTNRVAQAEVKVAGLETTVTAVTNLVYGLDGRILALEETTADHSRIITATTNTVAVLESAVAELQPQMAQVLKDIPKLFEGLNVSSQRLDMVEHRIDGILEAANTFTTNAIAKQDLIVLGRENSLRDDLRVYAEDKASAALNAAKLDATEKADSARDQAKNFASSEDVKTLTSAKKYTDDATNNVLSVVQPTITKGDEETLEAAKKYHDEHQGVDTNAVKDIARELDDEVKTDVKGYTDTQINIHSNIFAEVISNGSVTVYNDMRTGDSNTLDSANAYTDDALKNFRVDEILFGAGASNANPSASAQIVLGPSKNYPSVVFDSYNILLGIDSMVGYGLTEGKSTRYAAAIGTSNKAKYMHSYAFGSQLNALAPNSTTIGYGLTANDEWSTVIGHGNRSIHDKYFTNTTALVEFFSNPDCTNEIFVGYGVLVGSGPGCSHIVDEVLTEPNEDGLYATLRLDPLDIEVGYRRWDYGKSHGKGTFNIVARGEGTHIFDTDTGSKDPGPAAVFINDRSLSDWLGIHLGEQTIKPIYNKGIFGPETSTCVNDYTISIGQNARAIETATSCQAIAIGRDALSAGSATVAVGPNAFAYGQLATALGWRANAVGQHAIAIGSAKKSGENYFVDGAVNPNSDLCVAVGDDAIAIGFNAKAYNNKSVALGYYATAKADSAVQVGMGTNDAPKSVKFYDTTVFKDGKLVGAFNPEDLDPKKVQIDVVTADEVVVTCMPHRVNTLTSVTNLGVGTECYLQPTGSRNYDVFIPNKPEFRAGMPITLDIEIDNCTATFMDDKNQIYHLPAMVHVQQPDDDMILFTIKELKDKKYDWKPVVTNINIKFDLVAGKFFTEGNKKSLEGYNLHAATAYKITYPISTTETATADLVKVGTTGICSGTYFDYAVAVDFTPPADKKIFFTGTKSWFEITYTTHDGTAVIERQEISN